MQIIKNFLTEQEITVLLTVLEKADWQEGFTNSDKDHKDNYECVHEHYSQVLANKIKAHPIATNKLFMKRMTLPRFNKYTSAQKYKKHIDAFKQQGIQTDYSFTLMLKPAQKGGDLKVEDILTRLQAGDLVVYESGKVHQVTPVEKGERIAVIGWIESLITRPDERKILSNLVEVMQDLDGKDVENTLKLSESYHNLLRIWSK